MEAGFEQLEIVRGAGRRRAFSLIEILVTISLIAFLLTLVAAGLSRASESARRSASQRSASAMAQAVDQFREQFGFLPPLVHDGPLMSGGDDEYRPAVFRSGESQVDGPLLPVPGGTYEYNNVVAWNEGLDSNFFRRRTGAFSGGDVIDLPGGGEWDDERAWDDRRYSRYSLAYYLTGVLDRDTDGVRGPGFARPIVDGSFLGVGYPVGSVRDRFDPLMDVGRRGASIAVDYIDPLGYPEHDESVTTPPDRESVYSDYEALWSGASIDRAVALASIVDSFGNAFRYYRWEPGRFENGQLVIMNDLDLNIPPVFVDPRLYARVENDPLLAESAGIDLTSGNARLRDAKYGVVSAGPDGLFGTESIETIADFLQTELPSDLADQANLRYQVWEDNAWEVGN